MSDESWDEILRAVAAQVSDQLKADERASMDFGQPIAWAEQKFARTDELSEVHRVGFPKGDVPYTTCGVPIPHPSLWLALSDRFAISLGPCRFCEAELSRTIQENAA